MRSLPMTLLHEMTHVGTKGTAGHGDLTITDEASGAYDCFKIDTDSKGDNAQNYAWFAGDTYWGQKCSKTFKDPATGTKSVGEDEAPTPANTVGSPQCGGTVAFDRDAAISAINEFCNDRAYTSIVIVPAVSFGTGQTSDGRGKALGVDNSGVNSLWLSATFAESSCGGSYQFGGDTCVAQLSTIGDGCNTNTRTAKTGGWVQDVCAVYRVEAVNEGESSPLYLQGADGDLGAWTCQTTINTINSPALDNTCTCWYSNQDTLTDLFAVPASGNCADVEQSASPKIK